MLAVLSVVAGGLTLLLVEGSIVYYRHPSAPAWLRNSPSFQTSLSTTFGTGLVFSVVLLGQFFADNAANTLGLGQIVLIAGSLGVTVWLWRKIRAISRELDIVQNKATATIVEHPASDRTPDPRPTRDPSVSAPRKKAA